MGGLYSVNSSGVQKNNTTWYCCSEAKTWCCCSGTTCEHHPSGWPVTHRDRLWHSDSGNEGGLQTRRNVGANHLSLRVLKNCDPWVWPSNPLSNPLCAEKLRGLKPKTCLTTAHYFMNLRPLPPKEPMNSLLHTRLPWRRLGGKRGTATASPVRET